MKKIKIGVPQVITLNQANLPTDKEIYLSIYGESGNLLTNSESQELEDIQLTYNSTSKLYEAEVTINQISAEQYVRLLFTSLDISIQDIYSPEDAYIFSTKQVKQQIVPLQYFIDYVLNINSNADPLYKETLTNYISSNRNGLKSYLEAAQSNLEMQSNLYFQETTLTEKRDNNYEQFNIHFWQFAVNYPPINSLESIKLKFGNTEIADISTTLFKFERITGLVEFLPVPTGESAHLYNLLLTNLSMFGAGIINGGLYGRIPNMFEYTYKTGLITDGTNQNEKESIRIAVCRRAFIDLLNFIDNSGKINSISESMDGVSKSIGYTTSDLIRRLKEDEQNFITILQKRYGKGVDMVVV